MGWPWTKHWKLRSKSIGYGWFGWRRTESFGRSLQASWLSCDFEAPTPQNFTRCKGISGWWNFIFLLMFASIWGRWTHFDSYFCRWVETTNQLPCDFEDSGGALTPHLVGKYIIPGLRSCPLKSSETCRPASNCRHHHPWPHRSPNHRVVGFSTKLVMRWFRATKMRWAHVERRYLMYQYLFWWMATSIL